MGDQAGSISANCFEECRQRPYVSLLAIIAGKILRTIQDFNRKREGTSF
jgi:hypothetical protein